MNQVIAEQYALLISFRPNMTEEQFRLELQKAVRYVLAQDKKDRLISPDSTIIFTNPQ